MCVHAGVPDRASRRLFSSEILKPAGSKYCGDVSQRILSATACWYLIFWLCAVLKSIGGADQESMRPGVAKKSFFCPIIVRASIVRDRPLFNAGGGVVSLEAWRRSSTSS